MKDFL